MLSLPLLSTRRTVRLFVFLHKLINGAIDCVQPFGKVNLHAPLRVTTHFESFYVHSPCNISPLSMIRSLYNTTAPPHLDISSSITLYRSQLNEHLPVS